MEQYVILILSALIKKKKHLLMGYDLQVHGL